MTTEALKNLLQRHGKEIVEDAEKEDDQLIKRAETRTVHALIKAIASNFYYIRVQCKEKSLKRKNTYREKDPEKKEKKKKITPEKKEKRRKNLKRKRKKDT